jgi:P-type Cu+ transporter
MRVFARRHASGTETTVHGVQVRRIRVNEGYEPCEIHVKAGVPIRLVFRREESAPCSERVVFPDLGVSAGLPSFQDAIVELPASAPGTHRFCCEMNMIHGRLIVEPDGSAVSAAARGYQAVRT